MTTTTTQTGQTVAIANTIGLKPATTLRSAFTDAHYRMVTTATLPAIAEAIYGATGPVAIDTETSGLDVLNDHLCGISIGVAPGQAYYIPVAGIGPKVALVVAVAALAPALAQARIVGHNLAFDLHFLLAAGFTFPNIIGDTLVLARLIDPNNRHKHGLDDLALRLLQIVKIPTARLLGKKNKANKKTFDTVATDDATVYACEDVDATLRLFDILQSHAEERGLLEVVKQELALLPVVCKMERTGVMVDRKALRKLKHKHIIRTANAQAAVNAAAGRNVNLNSTPQLCVLLFDELGLPIKQTTTTGKPSTKAEALCALATHHDVPAAILKFRRSTKTLSSFIRPLRINARKHNGRVHGRFTSTGAATGRFSSSKPNLQNIPSRGEGGGDMRACFTAPPDKLLICVDYSQIELRCLAHAAQCPVMIAAFNNNKNFHLATAAAMFNKPESEISADEKAAAKVVNFGIPYGMSEWGLAAALKTTEAVAKEYMAQYFAAYPAVATFRAAAIRRATREGGVQTFLGRFRPTPALKRWGREYYADVRRVLNTTIQGSCAELLKSAMLAIEARIKTDALPLELLATVHDELLFEAPAERAEELLKIVIHIMENVWQWSVPIIAAGHVGRTWADAK